MTQLAERTSSTLPRLSHVASRLEGRGHLRRSPSPDDRRTINAQLTEPGWEKVQARAPGHVTVVLSTVLAPLDAHDVAVLDHVMGKVMQTMDVDPPL